MTLPSGAFFIDIALEDVDAKSPVDDTLATAIAEDLYYLKNNISGGGGSGGGFDWKVNGKLSSIRSRLPFRTIDGAWISASRTIANHAVFLELPGTSGTLEIDVRKYISPITPILEIEHQFESAISSISRAGASINTQSITRSTPQVSTQSISYWKTAISIDSIILLGSGKVRLNLATPTDADWKVGDYIKIDSATSGANNVTAKILFLNQDGGDNIVISNSGGVDQPAPAGNVNLQAFAYVLINPASTQFSAGEKALFASHTSGVNDGSFEIYKINQGANNIIVKNEVGVVQAGVAGTIDVLRFSYNYSSAVAADYVAGENALMASHTTPANNGNLPITNINLGGNNIVVYNPLGATQGGVAGTADTNRWIYALPNDPTTFFNAGEFINVIGATSSFNNGVFEVVEVSRSALDNLVVYNESGVTQGGAVGDLYHTRKILHFDSDLSAIYSTLSRVHIQNTSRGLADGVYDVVQVNRGGGANYNIVVEIEDAETQLSPAGRIELESKSIFSTRPTITYTGYKNQYSSNGVLDVTQKVIAANSMIAIDILQIPNGSPENLTVHIS